MEELKKQNTEAYEWLKGIPPHHWARSHFFGRPHCDVLLNNMCEVLNKKSLDGRDKPIITCLEFVRERLMKKIVLVQQVISKAEGPLTPNAQKLFNQIKKEASQYKVLKWELKGMPCKHAVASIWNMASNGLEADIPESWCHTPIGRPRKKRMKTRDELMDNMAKGGKLRREEKLVTCRICKQAGHNQRLSQSTIGSQFASHVVANAFERPNQGTPQTAASQRLSQVTPQTVASQGPSQHTPQAAKNSFQEPSQGTSQVKMTKQTVRRYSLVKTTKSSAKRASHLKDSGKKTVVN
ncbi:hypothetical protein Tco_0268339 [Tanacetum coccineum]